MVDHDLADLRSALKAGIPAGVLGTRRLPTMLSTTGALLHSVETADTCGELRMWGGVDGHSVKLLTMVEIVATAFVNDNPLVRVCSACYGEDLDVVDTCAELVLRVHQGYHRSLLPRLRLLSDAVERGEHRREADERWQTSTWQRLGDLRVQVDAACVHEGEHTLVQRLTRQLASCGDLDLAAWLDERLAELRADVEQLRAQMVSDRDRDDAAEGLSGATQVLVVPRTDAGSAWTRTPTEVARYVNAAAPLGWLHTGSATVPVALAPAGARLPTPMSALCLGAAEELVGPHLSARLEVASRLLSQSAATDPLADISSAFAAAGAIVVAPSALT